MFPNLVYPRDMEEFIQMLTEYYVDRGRHDLPWRCERYLNPYAIAVSEVMLQQTQVSRVIGYFTRWTELFPDVYALAQASNEDVLRAWQGLGYNNRGLRLKKLAQVIVSEYDGVFPRDRKSLEALPGIGPYTAGAIRAFVWNEPDVFVETNIRRVLIHYFFADKDGVSDGEVVGRLGDIIALLHEPPPPDLPLSRGRKPEKRQLTGNPRQFYWALMDYGSSLPKILKSNPNTQSKHYTKQSRFEGSVRQVRSGIVKWLLEHKTINKAYIADMLGITNPSDNRIDKAIKGLERDGLVLVKGSNVVLKT